jgi:adenosylcobinamide kinase/adenosylcobinamide-phosphate guanylyltransferase
MFMQLITGGAYTGKRKYIRESYQNRNLEWVSGYEGHEPDQWRNQWTMQSTNILVMEGWEEWIRIKLVAGVPEEDVQSWLSSIMDDLLQEEAHRASNNDFMTESDVIFIMLEMGRGIVPISPEERRMRDIIGRLTQVAAQKSKEAIYMWHGLPRVIKSN